MKSNFSNKLQKTPRIEKTTLRSNNSTLSTFRPSSSPFKAVSRSINVLTRVKDLNFEYVIENKNNNSQCLPFDYFFEKAFESYKEKKYTFALKLYLKALDLDRNNWKTWNNLGVCYLMVNDLNQAITCFHEVGNINKNLECFYFNIALAYLNFKKYQEAVLCLKSAMLQLKNVSQNLVRLEKYALQIDSQRQKSLLTRQFCKKKITKTENSIPVSKSVNFHTTLNNSSELATSQTGFNQVNLIEKPNFLNTEEGVVKEMRGKVKKLREKVYIDMKHFLTSEITEPAKLESKYLDENELRIVKAEFCKLIDERDYEKIDFYCQKLNFFQRFSKEIREIIFRKCEIKCFLPGEQIFSQGDVGENMYVVIKGGITVKREGNEFGGQNIVVNSLYDGRQFGELALLNSINKEKTDNKRTASCIAFEKTYLLCMPKLNYSEIQLLSNKKEIDMKINFFSSLALFKNIEKSHLMALASNIEKKIYKLNDTILDKGEAPKGLYIMFSGYAMLYTEGFAVKQKYTGEFSKIRTQKPKPAPIYHSLSPPHKRKPQEKCENFELSPLARMVTKEMNEMSSDKMRTVEKFLNPKEIAGLNAENHLVKERIPFSSVKEKDFFGARAILDGLFGCEKENSPSKFSIAAQSTTVELFLFTKYHFQFLTQEAVSQIVTILEKSYEIDCPPEVDSKEMDSLFKDWQSFKSQLIKDIRKENYFAKYKGVFSHKR